MRNTIKIGDKVQFDADRKAGTVTGWHRWMPGERKQAVVSWAHGRAVINPSKLTKV